MRALTVQQPYAYLIACGRKTAELRSKKLTANETIAIHAGKSVDLEACKRHNINPDTLKTGRILCVVQISDCVDITSANEQSICEASCCDRRTLRKHSFKKAHLLRNVRRCNQLPARGNLGLWEVKPQTNPKAAGIIQENSNA